MSDEVVFTPKHSVGNHNISKTHPLAELTKLLLGLGAVLLVCFFCLGIVTDYLVERHYDSLYSLFKKSPNLFVSSMKLQLEPPSSLDSIRVKSVFDKLVSSSQLKDRDYQVYVANSAEFNAYAFPGGHIVVLSGLLNAIESDQELAFVLGHEIAHQENKDSFRALGRSLALLTISAFLSGSDSTASGMFAEISNFANSRYSQAQEQAADELGLELLRGAYPNTSGAIEFLERAESRELGFEKYILRRSHPLTKDRIKNVRKLIQQQKSY